MPDLLTQIPDDKPIGTLTAEGARNLRRYYITIHERRSIEIDPIRRNGRSSNGAVDGVDAPSRRHRNVPL